MGRPTAPIELGMTVMDAITGFTGKVIGLAEYLYGYTTAQVQNQRLKNDGNMVKAEWIDVDRLIPMKPPLEETVAEPETVPEDLDFEDIIDPDVK